MARASYEHRKVEQLRAHPLNSQVFGDLGNSPEDMEFIQSIRERGVLEPCIVTDKNLLISGHRRRQGAIRAGLTEIPVIVRKDLADDHAVNMAWFDANRTREKTNEQKARWFRQREEILAKDAAKRMKAGAAGNPRANLPQGRAADAAAKEVGMSRKTAQAAAAVVEVIDEAKVNGDEETAARLTETLNKKSVAQAKREADKVKPPKKPRTKASKEVSPAKLVDQLTRKYVSPLVRGIDAVAKINGGKGECHAAASGALDSFITSLKKMREGKQ